MLNLLLCGFMGCGKTTAAKHLSRLTGQEYIDLDAQIEQEAGLPVAEIFSRFGESYFRDLEHEAVRGLSKRISCIVATGGGALTFPRNLAVLSPEDTVVFLDAPFEICYARIRTSDRPIVRQSSEQALRALFEQRRPLYLRAAQSGAVVDAGLSLDALEERILPLCRRTRPAKPLL